MRYKIKDSDDDTITILEGIQAALDLINDGGCIDSIDYDEDDYLEGLKFRGFELLEVLD